jgi:Ca2+-binding RTX toxin-like protein
MTASGLVAALLTAPLVGRPAAAGAPDPCAAPTIVGTAGDDELTGTDGPDVIAGLGGQDEIDGGAGDDVLCGGDGDDLLVGGDGGDRLYGGRDGWVSLEEVGYWSGDLLDGGPGDDLLDGGADTRHRGGTLDELTFDQAATGVEVDLAAGTVEGDGADVLVGAFRSVQGSDHADRIVGAALGEALLGGKGADRILGGGGADTITTGLEARPNDGAADRADGGPGTDEVTGGRGDRLAGGPGDDFLSGNRSRELSGGAGPDRITDVIAASGPQVVRGGTGRDRVSLTAPAAWRGTAAEVLRGRVELATGVARFRSSTGTVRVPLRDVEAISVSATGRWTLVGTPGNDELEVDTGRQLGALLIGRGGNDVLFGSWRGDVLRGGPGYDVAWGRGGRDRYLSIERRVS